jgi:serine/threonine-protein kinase
MGGARSVMRDLKSKTIIKKDKYEIIRKIGKGGSCEVWLAKDVNLSTYWVVKKTKKISIEMFEILRKLKYANHINVPQIIDCWEEDGFIFFVEDYIKGLPLNKVDYEKIDGSTIMEWAKIISETLEFIHVELLVVHRDIKPSNIVINEYGVPFLIDFGESVIMVENRDFGRECSYGTYRYASPEQILFPDKIDYKTDVYSFGVVFKEMLDAKNEVISKEFRYTIRKCMEILPENRCNNFTEVKEAIKKIIDA